MTDNKIDLRDKLAGQAMSALLLGLAIRGEPAPAPDIARASYSMADAMLKEREKGEPSHPQMDTCGMYDNDPR